MKTVISAILILSFAVCAHAADFSTINKDSLADFLELMPQYKAIVQKYSETFDEEDITDMVSGSQMYKSVQSLLSEYGISQEEFAAFMQKVTMAFATSQMEKSGMPAMPFGIGNMLATSEEEMNIIKENLEEIEEVFEEE